MFQQDHLLEDLTPEENIALPLVPRGLSLSAMEASVSAMVTALGLEEVARVDTRDLSGGERQRVAVARAFVLQPEVGLLDEPTAHQDESGLTLVTGMVDMVRSDALTVVASHDDRLVEHGFADRHLMLVDGGNQTVTLNRTDNPNAVLQNEWLEWRIPFDDLESQVDLTQIQKMIIGIGDKQPGGKGKLYIDDIRLYPE